MEAEADEAVVDNINRVLAVNNPVTRDKHHQPTTPTSATTDVRIPRKQSAATTDVRIPRHQNAAITAENRKLIIKISKLKSFLVCNFPNYCRPQTEINPNF